MAESTEHLQDFPIPQATFSFLVESILMQTQMQLGLLRMGDKDDKDEAVEPSLPLARHSIDMLAVLQEKTRGNLTMDEARLLENGLTELRFRYVQVADEVKRRREPEKRAETDEKKKDDDRPLIITADGGKGSKTE